MLREGTSLRLLKTKPYWQRQTMASQTRVDLIVEAATAGRGPSRAATAMPTVLAEAMTNALAGDDSSDDDVGELIWRSSRTGKALTRGATKAATVAAICSGRKRVTNWDLATGCDGANASMGTDAHSNKRHSKHVVEELFTASDEDLLAAASDDPHDAAGNATWRAPQSPSFKAAPHCVKF